MSDEEVFDFTGSGGDECERFIQFIRRKARVAGKQRDDEWIMDLVFSSLSGRAVRWESTLKSDIRSNWDRFREALLDRYPADTGLPASPSSTVPTPAAAVPESTLAQGIASMSLRPSELIGRISVIFKSTRVRKYISRSLDGWEDSFGVCDQKRDALIIRFTPSSELHTIQIQNCPQSYQWLALQKSSPNSPFSPRSAHWARLCGAKPGRRQPESSVKSKYPLGELKADIWKLAYDRTLLTIWDDGDCETFQVVTNRDHYCHRKLSSIGNHLLKAAIKPEKGSGITFCYDWKAFVRYQYQVDPEGGSDEEIRLIFEPL